MGKTSLLAGAKRKFIPFKGAISSFGNLSPGPVQANSFQKGPGSKIFEVLWAERQTESYYGGTYVTRAKTNFHNVFDENVTIEYNFVGGCCNRQLLMRRMEFLSYWDSISLTGFQS